MGNKLMSEKSLISENKDIEKRRNFFKYLSAGAISTSVLGLLPFKFGKNAESNDNNENNKIKVSIHPSAVKRG